MGVRGLTTFIKNNEKKYYKDYKLHNCKVLMDGNSIVSNLYMWSNLDSAFGGDYDKFAKYVKEFFKLLQKCDIRPLVIFDGGYEQRKLKTVYQRMRDKFVSARNVQPFSGSVNFPLFMRIVFREVLAELSIPFCQSDFEADDELAALARKLKCPVISYDSDFYIYDVLYIPFPTVNLQATAFKENELGKVASPKYYLECKIYNVDNLIQSFGGLDKGMLPILAALLGNDYIKRSVFKAFYINLKIPNGKTKPTQRRIQAVIDWLRNETFDSAIRKILGRMKKHTRRRVARQIRKITNGYIQCSSVVEEYLGINPEEHVIDKSQLIQVDTRVLTTMEESDKDVFIEETEEFNCHPSDDGDQVESNSEQSDAEEENCSDNETVEDVVSEEENSEDQTGIPDWLIVDARKGKIQSCVLDILCLNQYFCPPQVEDYSQSPSHYISLKILGALVGLLVGHSDGYVKYWTRRGSRLNWYTVEPVFETPSVAFPALVKLLDLDEHQRLSILLEVTDVTIDLQQFPDEWHLFVVAVVFWLKNMKEPKPEESHLHTIVMCLVALYTIDSNIGVHRNKQTFTKKYKNYLAKVTEARSKAKEEAKESNSVEKPQNEHKDPKTALQEVVRDDCIVIFESILPYHHLSDQLKAKPKQFCTTTIHAFAQFQSCLFHVLVLNSVLNFPLKETRIHQMFSGTFVYNMFANLCKRNNISAYVETFFQKSPTLLNLYNVLLRSFYGILGEDCLQRSVIKVNRRKKKRNGKLGVENENELISERFAEEDEFFDENNMFSKLSLKA